jgi:hypothetical protein
MYKNLLYHIFTAHDFKGRVKTICLSFLRKQESRITHKKQWIPAYMEMIKCLIRVFHTDSLVMGNVFSTTQMYKKLLYHLFPAHDFSHGKYNENPVILTVLTVSHFKTKNQINLYCPDAM